MKQLTLIFLLTFGFVTNVHSQTVEELNTKVDECFKLRDYECSEKTLLQLINIDKNSSNLSRYYSDLATSQRRLGKQKEALKAYDKAIKINPNRPVYYTNRSTLKYQMNDVSGALADNAKALKINPKSSDAYINRAQRRHVRTR